ncbi:MAG: DUF1295 domain-containing protein [Actinomycetota bacterium]
MVYSSPKKRSLSFSVVLIIYLLALAAAIISLKVFDMLHPLFSTFMADIAATLVVWFFGIMFRNSSVYDPYWSVAPMVIITFWVIRSANFSTADLLFMAAIIIWGTRLTINWAIRWKGLGHQDWRYSLLKRKSPKIWFFTNLFGINIMPTVIVFLAMVPAYFSIGINNPVNKLTAAGFLICLSAVLIQSISDRQMDLFKKSSRSQQYIDKGLWKYSRHPNYFGEVSFWWGIWLMQLGIIPRLWITIAGPLVMTLLFILISIPLMEKHILDSRPGYIHYRNQVSMLLPWFRNKNKEILETDR